MSALYKKDTAGLHAGRNGGEPRSEATWTRSDSHAGQVMRRSSSLTDTDSASLTKLVRHMSRGVSQSLQGGLLSLAGSASHLPGALSKSGAKGTSDPAVTDRWVHLMCRPVRASEMCQGRRHDGLCCGSWLARQIFVCAAEPPLAWMCYSCSVVGAAAVGSSAVLPGAQLVLPAAEAPYPARLVT